MSRIQSYLQQLAGENRKALIPYIVAGDPSREATAPTMLKMVEQGADIIELGVPFSDPMAEGPAIQLGHERALENNISLQDTLDIVAEFREQNQSTPVVLMGYANPIVAMGYEVFAEKAKSVGVDGLLTVDLPPEESDDLNNALRNAEIDTIYLIAPTTSMDRAKAICDVATGYLYYVSLKGVTGAGNLDVDEVQEKVSSIKKLTSLPICVGFGIKDAESAAAIARLAEGAVVGSVLVNKMGEFLGADDVNLIADTVASMLGEMRQSIDSIGTR